jgi:hypothetical protein
VALGGGYLMVLKTSGSGNSGTQPPRKKEPPDPRLQDPTFRIKDPPVPSIAMVNHFQSKRNPQFWLFQKILKEGSGSVKEPEVFWAVSYLTCLEQKKKKLENHGYI